MRAIIAVCLAFVPPIAAQQNAAAMAARQWRETHERAILVELASFLSLPNLADGPENLRRKAEAAGAMLEHRGVKIEMLQAPGSAPLVFGEIRTSGAALTLVFYAHYDGQALDPKEWTAPPLPADTSARRTRRSGVADLRAVVLR
jgi:acetylornithine deacetylase/succinyl-diaminopimelate desuccinylase-like protein